MAKSTKDAPEKLRPYLFHGIDINEKSKQIQDAPCPFCGKNGLAIKSETGQFRCVKCNESGNTYTFLARLYNDSLAATSEEDYESLAADRKLTVEGLRRWGLATSVVTSEWLMPAFNKAGSLTNLCRLVQTEGKYRFLPTPTLKVNIFGVNLLVDDFEHIWLTEGVWDAIALEEALIATGETEHGVLSVPGSNQWNPDWFQYTEGKDVRLVYDNDHPKLFGPDHPKAGELMMTKGKKVIPGWDGMQRVVAMASTTTKQPKSMSVIRWDKLEWEDGSLKPHDEAGFHPELPDGCDVRDLLNDLGPENGLRVIEAILDSQRTSPKEALVPGSVEPIECNSFAELCKHYAGSLYFTQHMQDTLAVMLAVILSTEMPESQLWLRVIGPPGSGKTTLAEAVSVAREYVCPKSVLTGFHSGYLDYDQDTGERKQDANLLNLLNNRAVVMKDADTLINSPSRDRILSELRDIYDGSSRSHYRNKVKDEFENLRLTFILCGTHALHSLDKSFLGERFVTCEIIAPKEDRTPFLQAASSNMYSALAGHMQNLKEEANEDDVPVSKTTFLKQVTYGFIKYLKTNLYKLPIPTLGGDADKAIQSMAQLVGYMRAKVERDGHEVAYRPHVELATRLTQQLVKLPFCLALVLGRSAIDTEVLRVTRKVMFDTSNGFQYEVTKLLAESSEGHSTLSIRLELNLPETSVRRLIGDMQEFGIIQQYKQPNNSGQRGRDRNVWQLTQEMQDLWNAAHSLGLQPTPTPKALVSRAAKNGKTESTSSVARLSAKLLKSKKEKSVALSSRSGSSPKRGKASRSRN